MYVYFIYFKSELLKTLLRVVIHINNISTARQLLKFNLFWIVWNRKVSIAPLLSYWPTTAPGPILAGRISRAARRGENIISGLEPFLIFRLHYDVLQTSWVANSIADALNTTLLRPAGKERRSGTPIYLNFYSDSIWEIVPPAALAKLRRQSDCSEAFNYLNVMN